MKPYFILLRPHQYIKNFFIFAPLFFAGQIMDIGLLKDLFVAFVAFSFCASSIYILNDYYDIEEDRKHPIKKNRPLASGAIVPVNGFILMTFLLIIGSALMFFLSKQAAGILFVYILMNIFYILYFKHIAILDVNIIATGFVLRLFVGAKIASVTLSMWIVVMTFLLSLFIALAKRRDDMIIYLDTGKKMRKVTKNYNLQFLDSAMTIMASVVIVSYILYSTSTEIMQRLNNEYLYLTVLFVIIGIMRYLQIALVEKKSCSPTQIVIKDGFMRITIIGWLLTFSWILYL